LCRCYTKAHSDETVRDATSAAIAVLTNDAAKTIAVDDIPSALAPLVALKGMGPATASAVLAAADASLPFMSDDIIAVALPPGKNSSDTYSMPRLLQLAAKVRAKVGLYWLYTLNSVDP
jgi:hypothetical protein